jgi:hypothetical protein
MSPLFNDYFRLFCSQPSKSTSGRPLPQGGRNRHIYSISPCREGVQVMTLSLAALAKVQKRFLALPCEPRPACGFSFKRTVLVRTAGIEPAQAFRPYGFSYQLRLSPPRLGAFHAKASSWSGLSLRRCGAFEAHAAGAARLVSTPSRRGKAVGLGSGSPLSRFPRL